MSIKSLQEKIGVTADGMFGPNTLKAAMSFYKFTPFRTAHFFGQTGHETGGFKIFSENLTKYRNILKEGNLLIFEADIIRNNNEFRIVIRKIQILESYFNTLQKKFDIYISVENLHKYKEEIFTKKNQIDSKVETNQK